MIIPRKTITIGFILLSVTLCLIVMTDLLPGRSGDAYGAAIQDEDEEFIPLDESNVLENTLAADSAVAGEVPYITDGKPSRPVFTRTLRWALVAIGASIAAGICLRFKATRNLRIVFLLGSVVVLGFYNGACPCPILSVMQTVRLALGKTVRWQNLVYFVGLIPVTYIFGRVWCGWVCHMGALQEFIHLRSRVDILRSRKAQNVFRVMRYLFLAGLIVWVAVTGSPRWCRYDPFKTAYTLFSATGTGWVLLGLMLVSSLFIYRPFCRGFCPIGLMLGWVSKIPGASVIGLSTPCPICLSCAKSCRIDAITEDRRSYAVDNEDCIGCGECIDACHLGGMALFRKSGSHPAYYKVDTAGKAGCPDEDGTS